MIRISCCFDVKCKVLNVSKESLQTVLTSDNSLIEISSVFIGNSSNFQESRINFFTWGYDRY